MTPRKPPPLPAEAFAFKEGDIADSRYRIQGLIGCGPIGQVYRAFDQELDITVALKAISPKLMQTPEERKSFSREIRLARKFSHQNLIHVHGDGTSHDWPFFTMQLLEGLTLRRIIDLRREKEEMFSLREVEPIFAQIAAALEVAHEVGPHGGVKPENVIVLPDLLKLTDFGLGLALPRQPFIAAQRAKGAHAYFAPEYLAGQEDVDRHIDIYAMGAILGEMLAGVRPEGDQIPDLRHAAPHLPAAIEALYRRALNENPRSRYDTPAEFLAELSSIIADLPDEGAGEGPADADEALPIDIEATPDIEAPPPLPPAASSPPSIPRHPVSSAKQSRAPRAKRPSAFSIALIFTLGIAISAPLAWFALRHKIVPAAGEIAAADVPQPPLPPLLPTEAPQDVQEAGQIPASAFRPAGVAAAGDPPGAVQAQQAPAAPEGASHKPAAVAATSRAPGADAPPAPTPASLSQPAQAPTPEPADARPQAKPEVPAAVSVRAKAEEASGSAGKPAAAPPPERQQGAGASTADGKVTAAARPASVKPAARAACPPRMKLIPSGTLKAGTTADDPMRGFGERSIESVPMSAYCIDLYEYPNRKGAKPQGKVTYAMAEATCAREGKRLCTENEWERACKGARNYRFPYGNAFDDEICNTQTPSGRPRELQPSGEAKRCLSSFGIADLSGNLAEWTSSPYNARGAGKAIKGGAANRPDHASRCSARRNGPVNKADADEYVGFRCCANPR